jgi:hypothetical protein
MSTLVAAGLFRMRLWTGLSAGAGVNACRSRTGQPRSRARPLMSPPACVGCGGRRRDTSRTATDKVFGLCLPVWHWVQSVAAIIISSHNHYWRHLPGSGGASCQRGPLFSASAVLTAVVLTRTRSSCSSWCNTRPARTAILVMREKHRTGHLISNR